MPTKTKTIRIAPQYREARIEPLNSGLDFARAEGEEAEKDDRTFALSFSSELPVERFFGEEVLDHSKGSVRMDRLKNGAPVLMNHDARDHVGVIESAEIDSKERVGRAIVRLGEGPRRDEVLSDIRSGILRTVSVGYRVHGMKLDEADETGETYRVTDWEPFEITLTPVPADATVGVGRSQDEGEDATDVTISIHTESRTMPEERTPEAAPAAPAVDVGRVADEAITSERRRMREINAMATRHNAEDLAEIAIDKGWSLDQMREAILDRVGERREIASHTPEEVGLSDAEKRRFSFARAMCAQVYPDNKKIQAAAAFEREASEATAQKFGRTPEGLFVPPEVLGFGDDALRPHMARIASRALSVANTGANVIAEDLLGGSFIELLRAMSVLTRAGVTVLDGLEGNVAIPRQSTGLTAYWLANDTTAITESDATIDQVPLTPKNIGGYTRYTRQLLMQSSISVEAFFRADLARVLALGLDLAGLYGSGAAGQPEGIANTTGINAPTAFAGAIPTWAEIVAMETAVASDNALLGSLSYITSPTIKGGLKTTEKFSGSGREVWEKGDTVNGYSAEASTQCAADGVFFGNFADLVLGMWGGLDLMANPYTDDVSRQVRVSAIQSADYAVRHPESFAYNS